MTRPYARDGYVRIPVSQHVRREIIWRVADALATIDDTAHVLLKVADANSHAFPAYMAKAEALTQAAVVESIMSVESARHLRDDLNRAILDAMRTEEWPDPDPVFRTCRECKRLRPDTFTVGHAQVCGDCYHKTGEVR